MSTNHFLSRPVAAAAVAVALLTGGCQGPATISSGVEPTGEVIDITQPLVLGPPMQDTRTETAIQRMEMDYNAAKNSRPTQQHVVEARKQAEENEAAGAQGN